MGGFYNPYARSVSPELAPRKPAVPQTENAAAPHAERHHDVSGGFSNPYARSVEK